MIGRTIPPEEPAKDFNDWAEYIRGTLLNEFGILCVGVTYYKPVAVERIYCKIVISKEGLHYAG